MALAIGQTAPDFKLANSDNKFVSLSDYKGKSNVIIHFFPAAFTGVCTEQLCTMRDNMNYYSSLGCVVLGISVDMPFALSAFKAKENYNFDLLSDFNKETIHTYDVYFPNFAFGMRGVAARAVFVINKDGVIVHSEQTAHPGALPDFDAVKKAVESIK
jgi:glutaredoxin-dependent peroxiredoxin